VDKKKKKTKGWMDLVAIIAVIGLGYLAIAVSLGTFQPIGAVISGSMEPVLSRGDLVILRKVAPADIRVGDIAQVEIPRVFQEQFGLPPNNLHRITDIQQTGNNVQFITKGDANTNIDPVPVSPDRVGGIVVYDIPQLGNLFLFLNSPQGRIFALIMGVSVVGYILYIAVSDNWRNVVVAAQTGAGTLSPEAAEQALGTQEQAGGEPLADAAGGEQSGVPPGLAPGVAVGQTMASADLRLVAGVSDERLEVIETGIHETRDSLQHFTAAIADYGTHLQSHTATVQAMSTASQSLVQAVDRQNVVLERLETTLDRDSSGGILRSSQRRGVGRTGINTAVGTQTGSPARRRAARRVTDIVGSVDGRPTLNAPDGTTRRRVSGRRATTGGSDFRRALRKVSAKRPPRPEGAG